MSRNRPGPPKVSRALPTVYEIDHTFAGFVWLVACPACERRTKVGQDKIGIRERLNCACGYEEEAPNAD